MSHAQQVAEALAHIPAIKAATTREQIGTIYADIVGYDSAAEDPQASIESLRALALGVVQEICYAENIPCASVGLPEEDIAAPAL